MKTKTLLLGCICILVAIASCKKYDDGPSLSLRSKKSRLVNEWKYEQVINNHNVNVTSDYANCSLEIAKDETYILKQGTFTQTGTWQFDGDKENVVLTDATGYATSLHILRLKKNEFWFTDEYSYSFRMISK